MKSMWPPLVAIFFMTCLYRAGGGEWPHRHPSGSATEWRIQDFSDEWMSVNPREGEDNWYECIWGIIGTQIPQCHFPVHMYDMRITF